MPVTATAEDPHRRPGRTGPGVLTQAALFILAGAAGWLLAGALYELAGIVAGRALAREIEAELARAAA